MNKDRLQMYISVTKITIILCWLSLFAFWAIKIFGGNWFEIMVENENFVKFSDIVQNTWLKYLVSFVTIFIAKYFAICAIGERFTYKGKSLVIVTCLIISMWAVANFIPLEILKMYYAYIVMILFSIIMQKKWKKLYGVFAIALEFVFMSVSMLTRNISLSFVTNYLLIAILIIDLYLMLFLYYLYVNLIRLKKEI